MYQFKFRIPPAYTLLIRSLAVLEGVALSVDPDYKVVAVAYPWVAKKLLTDDSTDMQLLLQEMLYEPGTARFRFEKLQDLLTNAAFVVPAQELNPVGPVGPVGPRGGRNRQEEDVRIITSLPRSRSVPRSIPPLPSSSSSSSSSSLSPLPGTATDTATDTETVVSNPALLLLAPEAAHVRRILVRELAKGLDAGVRIGVDRATQSQFALAAPSDETQWAGLRGILVALGGGGGGRRRGGGGGEFVDQDQDQDQDRVRYDDDDVAGAVRVLTWLWQEAQGLPPAAREELLRILQQVVREALERSAARGVRTLVAE